MVVLRLSAPDNVTVTPSTISPLMAPDMVYTVSPSELSPLSLQETKLKTSQNNKSVMARRKATPLGLLLLITILIKSFLSSFHSFLYFCAYNH